MFTMIPNMHNLLIAGPSSSTTPVLNQPQRGSRAETDNQLISGPSPGMEVPSVKREIRIGPWVASSAMIPLGHVQQEHVQGAMTAQGWGVGPGIPLWRCPLWRGWGHG